MAKRSIALSLLVGALVFLGGCYAAIEPGAPAAAVTVRPMYRTYSSHYHPHYYGGHYCWWNRSGTRRTCR